MSTSEKGIIAFVVGLMTFGFIAFLGPGPLWGLLGAAIASSAVLLPLMMHFKASKQGELRNAEQFAADVAADGIRFRDNLAAIAAELPYSEFKKKIEEILPVWDKILNKLDTDPSTALDVSNFHSSVAESIVAVAQSYPALKEAASTDPDSKDALERAERQMSEMPDRFRKFLSEQESASLRHINVELDLLDDRKN